MKFLALLLALLSCAYANKVAKEMVAALMEIHVSIRDNFTVLGRKLAPLVSKLSLYTTHLYLWNLFSIICIFWLTRNIPKTWRGLQNNG